MATSYKAHTDNQSGKYEICFETTDYDYFKMVERACQKAIDKKDIPKFVELPCKVGDTIYQIGRFIDGIKTEYVKHFRVLEDCVVLYSDPWDGAICEAHQVGKIVEEMYDWNGYFLAKEEAEKALKERRDNDKL